MWNQKPSFRFEIDNFSEKEAGLASHVFVSGGCEWYLNVWPKGHRVIGDQLSVFLYVANHKSLGTGWKRTASYYYVALNQSDKELCRSSVDLNRVFRAETPGCSFPKIFGLPKFQEKGYLENDRLIIEVYVHVVEVVDGEGEDVSEKKETVDINGFQVFASQVTLVRKIFAEHPDIAINLKPKNQLVKTEYMNVLLGLIETLNKPLHRLSETEISNAQGELSELTDEGFKLNWLKTKLGEVSLERKKSDDADVSRVQQLEERVKNLELMDLGSLKLKLEEVSLERKKSDDADVSRIQKLEERVKNLEVMELGFKMDCLKSKFDEDSLVRNKPHDADGSRVQQHEERIKNLEKIVSNLKVELDKEKAKSSIDGFLLVDEVCLM